MAFRAVVNNGGGRWQLGCPAIDAALPDGQLLRGGLHDFSVARSRDTPAMGRFVLGLLQRLAIAAEPDKKPASQIIWCQSRASIREHGRPYGPGLQTLGLAPEQLVFVCLNKERDLAFVMEEGLRSGAVSAVIGEGRPVGFTASRRLSLACQEMAVPCLLLNTTSRSEASAATTRWRIAPAIGPPDADDPQGPGRFSWSVVLTRARGGRAHPESIPWTVLWNDATHSFNLVTPAGNRTLADRPPARPAVGASRYRSAYQREQKTG